MTKELAEVVQALRKCPYSTICIRCVRANGPCVDFKSNKGSAVMANRDRAMTRDWLRKLVKDRGRRSLPCAYWYAFREHFEEQEHRHG